VNKSLSFCVLVNAGIRIGLALYFFFTPALILVRDLQDPTFSSAEIPRFTFDWHAHLSDQYESWARQRVASGRATELNPYDISGTEWPVYSSVFYLWATESLQSAWEEDPTPAPAMPKEYARGAIEAAAALVADPNHAAWVKKQWGSRYLERGNLFYRMLLISGLTSYRKLTGDEQYQGLLSNQVESLSAEMDRSPYGLLDDYPGQCYSVDVLPAIAAIRRADQVLSTDHSAFAARALRAFQGTRLDKSTGLPAYRTDAQTGLGQGPARGVGLSYMLIWAPELWPETARMWYTTFGSQFWQQTWGLAGFREFYRDMPQAEWGFDVDAGPVVAGYGTAADAFGVGATRANGHLDQAYPLAAETLVASWPLPDGTLLMPRLLSNASDAPYVGEAALLFAFTRRPVQGVPIAPAQELTPAVYLGIALYVCAGILGVGSAFMRIAGLRRRGRTSYIPARRWQFLAWIILLFSALACIAFSMVGPGVLFVLLAQLLPRGQARAANANLYYLR
jgi:hypothetical protein